MSTATATVTKLYPDELPADETANAWAGWGIEDLSDLDWALSRLADLEREAEENLRVEAATIARAQLRTKLLNEKLEKGATFFKDRIRAYAETHKAELLGGGKKKSRALLHGVLSWKKQRGGLEVKDKEALLEWARSQPIETGVLRIKEDPALAEIQKWHEKTGEVPPGTELKTETDVLTVEAVLGGNNGN